MTEQDLMALRHHLHAHPEVSGEEEKTSLLLADRLRKLRPDALWQQLGGGHGLVAWWHGSGQGTTTLFRADMDALPIADNIAADYQSQHPNVGHKCGHDGHTTMVFSLAPVLAQRQFSGTVGLIFQAAEETGEGAAQALGDSRWKEQPVDRVFGLHNLPGVAHGQVVIRQPFMAAASLGLRFAVEGHSSHAAFPHQANSPRAFLASMLMELPTLSNQDARGADFRLVTVVHARLGQEAYGTTPGRAVLSATVRAYADDTLAALRQQVETTVQQAAAKHGLKLQVDTIEPFQATENDQALTEEVAHVVNQLGMDLDDAPTPPFPWSEDFGRYKQLAPSCFLVLGAGEQHAELHHPTYDFPDSLLPLGGKLWRAIFEFYHS